MTINWPLVIVLFSVSTPGVIIAMKRLIYFLLPENSDELKRRISGFAILHTLVMVFIMSIAGAMLSKGTGLRAGGLESILNGTAGIKILLPALLPALLYAALALLIFCFLYYGLAKRVMDEKSMATLTRLRLALGLDGCVLYGGVAEEVIGRWGLLNLAAFFALILTKEITPLMMWLSILSSGLIFAVGQLPAYLAAGCTSSRPFIYTYILLSLSQSVVFGYVFWQYGLICSILAHMLFHLGWALFDSKQPLIK